MKHIKFLRSKLQSFKTSGVLLMFLTDNIVISIEESPLSLAFMATYNQNIYALLIRYCTEPLVHALPELT